MRRIKTLKQIHQSYVNETNSSEPVKEACRVTNRDIQSINHIKN
jgi:hypothetical protein